MSTSRTRDINPWWVAFAAGMATYVDQVAIVGFGTALVLYQTSGAISPDNVGVLTSLATIFLAVGALSGGRLGDRYGRRRVFLVTMVLIVVGTGLSAAFTSFPVLLVAFALFGVGTGADIPVSLATISESADDSNRAKLVIFSNLMGTAGITTAMLCGIIFGGMGVTGGRLIFTVACASGVLGFLLRLTIPESQSWEEARAEVERGTATIRATRRNIRDLLTGDYAKPLWTLLAYYTLTTVAVLVSGQFGTYVAVNVAGMEVSSYSAISMLALPAALIGGLWFMKVADTPRRMPYYVVGAIGVVLSYLIPAAFGFTPFTVVLALVVITIAGAFCYETMMKVWTQESFPVLLRSTAQGTVYAVSRVAAALLAVVTPSLLGVNPRGLYGVLGLVAAAGLTVGYLGFHRTSATAFDVERDEVSEVTHV